MHSKTGFASFIKLKWVSAAPAALFPSQAVMQWVNVLWSMHIVTLYIYSKAVLVT